MTATDFNTLNRIIDHMISVIEKSQTQIFDISENARSEYNRIKVEIAETRAEVNDLIQKVDEQERLEKKARVRLMEVSRDLKRYSEQDIRDAYDDAREAQVTLSVMREKESYLLKRRDELERRLKSIHDIVEKAEKLISQVGIMLKFITGDLEELKSNLGKMQKRQHLGWWVIQAQEEERKRVAREIHDGPAQTLANIFMRLEYCTGLWDKDLAQVKEELQDLKGIVKESLQDLRKVIFDLRPHSLDDLGLVPALKRYLTEYENKYMLKVQFVPLGISKRPRPVLEVAIFRLIQEALTNVRKHAQAAQAVIRLEITSNFVTVSIKDDGRGFNPETAEGMENEHYGITNMRERVEILSGVFEIKSSEGRGTEIRAKIPLEDNPKRSAVF
ncbi:MAG: sensor histidine kinase [Firmicutes bacterium]|nr:sensor histidine kinase [Bacillota bacterium]